MSSDSLFNPKALDEFRQMGPDGLKLANDLLDHYLTTTEESIGEIELSHALKDWDALKVHSHTLKSSSANIGALAMGELCREIEKMMFGEVPMDEVALEKDVGALMACYLSTAAELKNWRK